MILRAEKLETAFPTGSTWRHQNGRVYEILGVANIANPNPEYPPVIVYRSAVPTKGALLPSRLWTKSPRSFRAKMTRVSTP